MAFDDGDPAADPAVGERETGTRGPGQQGADPGNHLEGNAGGFEGLGLLATPPEHERVAPLEPGHPLAGLGLLDQQPLDVGLPGAGPTAALAHGQDQGLRWEVLEETRVQEGVVEDHLRRLQGPQAPHRDEVGVSGAGTDEADETRGNCR